MTLALAYDIDAIAAEAGRIARGLAEAAARTTARRTRRRSCSSCARATRKGIKDWDDLVKPGVSVITPNPKTSGGARWNYLAAWGWRCRSSRRRRGEGARSSSRKLYKNVPVLDSGARGSTTTFAQRGIGDVLIAWENEAYLPGRRSWARTSSRSSRPAVSILAEPPVAVVDKNVDKHGTRAVAEAYLKFLYTRRGAGDRRQALLPAAQRGRRQAARSAVPEDQAVHRRRGVRRLAEGAEDALRRRRHVRPDLPAGIMRRGRPSRPSGARARRERGARRSRARAARLRAVARRTRSPTWPARADPAGRARLEDGLRSVGSSGDGDRGAARAGGVPAELRRGVGRRPSSTSCSAARRLGAGRATSSRASGFVDALVDLPFALPTAVAGHRADHAVRRERVAGALPRAARHQGGVRARGRRGGADLRRAAVRGADRAAGAAGARRAHGRGGGHAGRVALAHVAARDLPGACCPRAHRLRAGVRARRRRVRLGRLHLRATCR